MSDLWPGLPAVRDDRHPPRRPGLPAGPGPGPAARSRAGLRDGRAGRRHGRQERRPQGRRPGAAHRAAAVRALFAEPRRPDRSAEAARARGAPDDQADGDHVRGRAAQHDRRLPHQPDARMRLRPRRRFAHLSLPRRRDGEPIDRPLVRAAAGRRAADHRGRSQQPSAVEPADRLPRHLPGPAAVAEAHRPARDRRQRAVAAATACGTTSRRASWAPSSMPCRRARPPRCWSARRVSGRAARATTCRWRWSGSSRWPEAARASPPKPRSAPAAARPGSWSTSGESFPSPLPRGAPRRDAAAPRTRPGCALPRSPARSPAWPEARRGGAHGPVRARPTRTRMPRSRPVPRPACAPGRRAPADRARRPTRSRPTPRRPAPPARTRASRPRRPWRRARSGVRPPRSCRRASSTAIWRARRRSSSARRSRLAASMQEATTKRVRHSRSCPA